MGADSAQSLALQRTFLAYERTLMAWVRTSTSLISFGFSIYKFFVYLAETEGAVKMNKGFGPREFAMAMISIGVTALVLAVFQERKAVKLLESRNDIHYSSLAEKLAVIIVVLGVFLLAVVMMRW
jgi:putative membrane protein